MKKLLAVGLIAVMSMSTGVFAEEIQEIEIGTSGIVFTAPADYVSVEISEEDTDENQVAYYKSETSLMDFDLYQWAKADGETLASAAEAEAAEYEATAKEVEVNGLAAWYYEAEEEAEGEIFPTQTYMMENGDIFAEIVFWIDGDDAEELVATIMDSITVKESAEITESGNEIRLGTSSYKITTPVPYVKGELSAEDTNESQVAYYVSDETLVDFDVYQWAKAESETAEGVATEEAAEFDAEVVKEVINGIEVYGYNAEEEFDGTTYNTITAVFETEDDFVELVFWLDGDDAEDVVDSILSSLTID